MTINETVPCALANDELLVSGMPTEGQLAIIVKDGVTGRDATVCIDRAGARQLQEALSRFIRGAVETQDGTPPLAVD